MTDLYGETEVQVEKTAIFSPCNLYRYRLTRIWDKSIRPACFLMLNPSTATAELDDPTIRRCIKFSKRLGAGGLVVVNCFAFRSPYPSALLEIDDPIGPENDRYIRGAIIECAPVVAAWGVNCTLRGRDRAVKKLIELSGLPWAQCLGTTKDGHPRHPLYVSGDTQLEDLR